MSAEIVTIDGKEYPQSLALDALGILWGYPGYSIREILRQIEEQEQSLSGALDSLPRAILRDPEAEDEDTAVRLMQIRNLLIAANEVARRIDTR